MQSRRMVSETSLDLAVSEATGYCQKRGTDPMKVDLYLPSDGLYKSTGRVQAWSGARYLEEVLTLGRVSGNPFYLPTILSTKVNSMSVPLLP